MTHLQCHCALRLVAQWIVFARFNLQSLCCKIVRILGVKNDSQFIAQDSNRAHYNGRCFLRAYRQNNNPEFSRCWKCKSMLKGEIPGTNISRASYKCPKCENVDYEMGEIRVAGGILGKLFDVEGKKFTALTCEKCSYTEFFKTSSSMMSNIFDLFIRIHIIYMD